MVAFAKVPSVIVGRNITVSLGRRVVLNDVSVELKLGQVTALCGPNGAGKSTLLAALAGEHSDCAEHVRYEDLAIADLAPRDLAKRRVVLEQNPTLSADFLVTELLELGVPIDLAPNDLVEIKSQVARDLGLEDVMTRFVGELSGGQRHRTQFARVLALLGANLRLGYRPFLFLDEPTASLDLGHQVTLLKHVRSLAREGVGSLVVLHDLNLAAAYADQVVLLKDGELFEEGPPETVLNSGTLSAVYETEIMVDRAKTGQQIIQPVLTA